MDDPSTAFLNEGTQFSGTCTFNGTAVVSGAMKGDVRATAKLVVERTGRLEARVDAPTVVIDGEVVGEVTAERIELRRNARVYGNLETAVLIIEEGALFDGKTQPRNRRAADGLDFEPSNSGGQRWMSLTSPS